MSRSHRNRARWNAMSDWYQETHDPHIGARPRLWGAWAVPEEEVGALGDVRGLWVLELGCGGAQWASSLVGEAARVIGVDISEEQLAAARVLRPGGRLVFNTASPWLMVCYDDGRDVVGERLRHDYFDLYLSEEGEGAATYTLPYGEWIRLFRRWGLAVEDLIEIRPPKDSRSTYFTTDPPDWTYRWPAESLWVTRKEG